MKITSLRKQLLIMSGILAITLSGLTFWLSGYVLDLFNQDISRRNLNLSQAMAEHTEHLLSRPVQELAKLMELIEMKHLLEDVVIQKELDDILRFNPFFELIQLLNNQGQVTHVAPYKRDHVGLDMSSHPYFRSVREMTAGQSSRRAIWSDGFISSQTGALSATISVPFKSGVVIAQLNLDQLSSILQISAIGKGGFAAVTDTRGVVMAHSDKSMVKKSVNIANLESVKRGLKGEAGSWDETWKHQKGMASVTTIDMNRWIVIIFQPDSISRAIVSRVEQASLILIVIAFLIFLIVQYFILAKLMSPLKTFEDQSRRVADGEYHHKIVPDYRELAPLTQSFNTMADRIRFRERELIESEEKYRAIFEGAKEGIMLIDPATRKIHFTNSSIRQMLGYDKQGIEDKDILDLCLKDDEKDTHGILTRILTQHETDTVALPFSDINGDVHFMEMSASAVSLKGVSFLCAFFSDVTQKLKMEAEKEDLEIQLLQTQKIEAIGVLAGGIAHDFNNLLFPILGYAEILEEDIPKENAMYGPVREIMSAALRAKDLVSQILVFSRQSEKEIVPIQLQPVLKEAVKLIRSSLPTTISVDLDIDINCGRVVADPTQIHQVVMNLVTNAYHAMQKKGGRLHVSLRQQEIDAKIMKRLNLPPGPYAVMAFMDTGEGIKKEIMDKIFDPYFTTKSVEKGTGLGLSVVQGIVKNSDGNIHVISEPGKGTRVNVYLPILQQASEEHGALVAEPEPGGSEAVLLVDDEMSVVNIGKTMLERLGYQVTIHTESERAYELFLSDPDRFDLIISDMTMPGMTGLDLLKGVKKIRPDLPFIICSGFSDQINEKRSRDLGLQGFISKPIVRRELALKVRHALEGSVHNIEEVGA